MLLLETPALSDCQTDKITRNTWTAIITRVSFHKYLHGTFLSQGVNKRMDQLKLLINYNDISEKKSKFYPIRNIGYLDGS